MHSSELRFERAFRARGVGIDARDARWCAIAAAQRLGQLLLQPLGAAADRRDVEVAALRACARHTLGEAAVVTAQRAIELVEHAPRAAVRATALPAAIAAMQHRRIAAAVEEDEALLSAIDARLQRVE